jgi:hypothetical protein
MNDFLKTLFPLIGTALGGPAGTMLGGVAASFVAEKLGLADSTVEAVKEALSSGKLSADQIAALKLAEIDMKKWADTNKIDVMKVEAADRADARDMLKITRSKMPAVLTCFLGVAFISVLVLMFFKPEVKESAPLMIMLGVLGAEFSASCKFWLGTTNSSADKNQMLANSAPNK